MRTYIYRIFRDEADNISDIEIEGELFDGSVIASYANHGYQAIQAENRDIKRYEVPMKFNAVEAHNRYEAEAIAKAECGLIKQIWI